MINVEQTIISQFANSPVIVSLVRGMSDYFDKSTDFDNFYKNIWNIDTAVGFGLDIWGRIVALPRALNIDEPIVAFGFETSDTYWKPFNQAPFYSGETGSTSVFMLSDDYYRRLILTKAMANILITSAPAMNRLLNNFFAGRGRCYVTDNNDMTFVFHFEFSLEPFELAAVTKSGAFPRPAGVSATVSTP